MTVCVLATSRPWHAAMAARLTKKTGITFHLIQRKEDLNPGELERLNPEYVFLPHWSYRIPEDIYARFTCVVFHMTDVPFGRGGSPLQNLIARGVCDTQMSALQCVGEMDAGPVYLKRPLSLQGAAEEIYLRAGELIEAMILEILAQKPQPRPQEGEAVLFERRKPEQSRIQDSATLRSLFDHIRMLDAEGYPRAFLEAGPFRFEFSRAALKEDCLAADVRITLKEQP